MRSNERISFQVKAPHLMGSGISDPGLLRSKNEDAICLDKDGHFMLLADGMGGHERGAEASQTALDIIQEYLNPSAVKERLEDITAVDGMPSEIVCLYSLVDEAVEKANAVLFERNKEYGLERYMGTTVVGLVPVVSEFVLWFHVGDSRLYLFRESKLKRLTTDHSAYEEWKKRGKQGQEPEKNIITRAIGPKEGVKTDIEWDNVKQHDIYVLCSDGLSDMISDETISTILRGEKNVEDIAKRLIDASLDAGGKDNTSVVVCKM
jgi:protein phosphatase